MRDPSGSDTTGPEEQDGEAARFAAWLFAQPCSFLLSVAQEEQLPPPDLPEVAVIGRSNVGKSSLINALVGQKALAKVSRTPGRTQMLNFFDLGGRLTLVDLPGYGYAEAPKKTVANWTALIRRFLRGRTSLVRTLVLIDLRHGIKETDRAFMKLLDEAAQSYQLVGTKLDLVKPTKQAGVLAAIESEAKTFRAAHPEILKTSANTGEGLDHLRLRLAQLALTA